MSVSDDDMYKGIMQESSSPYACSRGSDFMKDSKCNARCEFIAKQRKVLPRLNDTTGSVEYPTIYRRDLNRCIYDDDSKCKVPTVEACKEAVFKDDCGPGLCDATCNGFAEATEGVDVQNAILQQQFEDNGMCRDGRVVYTRKGSMLDNYFTGLTLLTGLFSGSTRTFSTNAAACDSIDSKCIDLTLEEGPDSYYIVESTEGDFSALIPSLAGDTTPGKKKYRAVFFNSYLGRLGFKDQSKNMHTLRVVK